MPHPSSIQSLIQSFSRFPGIGPKTAERFVFYLLKQPKIDLENLSLSIKNLKDKINFCSNCFNLCENEITTSHSPLIREVKGLSPDSPLTKGARGLSFVNKSSHTDKLSHTSELSYSTNPSYGVNSSCPARPRSSDRGLCSICRDSKRDQTTICLVAEVQDLEVIEKTHQYQGVYHVLGGTLNALEGITPEKLRIKELIERIHPAPFSEKSDPVKKNLNFSSPRKTTEYPVERSGVKNPRVKIREIILAFDPNLEGETTVLYLTKLLKPYKIRLFRLARGLPMGGDLEYTDEITLSNALKERREIF